MSEQYSTVNGVGKGHITKIKDGKTLMDNDFKVKMKEAPLGFGLLTDGDWDLQGFQEPQMGVV